MSSRIRTLAIALGLALWLPALGCGDSEPAAEASRQMDEAAEETAGAFEDLGREVGEAADESKEAADEIRKSLED